MAEFDQSIENIEDESGVVTMLDVLQDQHDLEEDAKAVLGASDREHCTYDQVRKT